jgi:predicted nuclease of predicted toxin-antitoxin system
VKRFLVDNQLPVALAHWIESRSPSAQHVASLNLAQADDDIVWRQAARDQAVIVSKDEDFANLILTRPEHVVVIWIRIGNCRTAELLAVMERAWPEILRQLDGGARLIEVC